MAEAERCDRVALMAEGRVPACGPPASLRAATGTIVAVIEADPWQRAYAELAAQSPGTTCGEQLIRVSLPAGADPRSLLAESLSAVRVNAHPRHRPVLRGRLHLVHQAQPPVMAWRAMTSSTWAPTARCRPLDHLGRRRTLRGDLPVPDWDGAAPGIPQPLRTATACASLMSGSGQVLPQGTRCPVQPRTPPAGTSRHGLARRPCRLVSLARGNGSVSFEGVPIDKPADMNVIIGRRTSSRPSKTCMRRWPE